MHTEKQRYYFTNKGPSSQGHGVSSGHLWMSELDGDENWAPKNWCFWTVMLEKTLPWTARSSNLSILKEISTGVHWKDWCLSWNPNTLDTSCEVLTHWKRPWSWEGLWAGGEGDDREWDGWMASPTQWMWVWASSGSWWWTQRSDVQACSWGCKESDTTEQLNWIEPLWWKRHFLWGGCSF